MIAAILFDLDNCLCAADEPGQQLYAPAAGWEILCRLEVTTPMQGYGDLDVLRELPVMRFLITSGFGRLQESKLQALGIGRIFTAIHVDAIDQPGYRGKQAIFEDILRGQRLQPDQVLIVGDNHDSEIAIGVRLGIRTVQTLRPGVPRSAIATHHIRTLHELKLLLT